MTFLEAVKTVLTERYFQLNGRASRSEYWWFFLAFLIGAVIAYALGWIVYAIYCLALLSPMISVGFRRMQDTGRPGWYYLIPTAFSLLQTLIAPDPVEFDTNGMPIGDIDLGGTLFSGLLGLISLVIFILFIWWLTRPSEPETNAYGAPPAA